LKVIKLLKPIFQLLVEIGVVWPIVFVYSRVIDEIKPDHKKKKLPAILALTHERFRKDLDVLANTGEFRVLTISSTWQERILTQFYPTEITKKQIFNSEMSVEVHKAQQKLHAFLRIFLPLLYRRLGVKCVLGASLFYLQDVDWGNISEEIKVPFILILRENYGGEAPTHKRYKNVFPYKMRFQGSKVMCQNESVCRMFLHFGYVTSEKIVALGCLRMDEFIEKVKSHQKTLGKRKKVLLFSFSHGNSLIGHPDHVMHFDNIAWSRKSDVGWIKLFESVHSAFARLAIERPDIDFIIKPKWLGIWKEKIENAVANQGINLSKISNIQFTEEDTGTLILDSDVVCSFGSNTIVEAGFAAKPVIIPMYHEANRQDYREFLWFCDYYHLYDIAESEESFIALIKEKLVNPAVENKILEKRKALFGYTYSSTKSDAAIKYTKVIKDVIRRNYAL